MGSLHTAMSLTSLSAKLRPLSPILHHGLMSLSQLPKHALGFTSFQSPISPHQHQQQRHETSEALHHQRVLRPVKAFGAVNSEADKSPSKLVVVSFYKFAHIPDFAEKKQPLKELCEEMRVSGGIILALEGINGSICGTRDAVERVLDNIQSDERLANIRRTESPATEEQEEIHHGHTDKSPLAAGDNAPFRWGHVRVKLKNEIVTMGVPEVSPTKEVGKYVKPREWNSLIQEEGTVVVDVRNTYEIRIGKFKGSVDPETESFREFPDWVSENILKNVDDAESKPVELEHPKKLPQKVAMYCTGGIRCEKATSFLMSKGFKEVYHLEGGILKYLEEVPPSESLWEGECFVFDKRVSVEHGLKPGNYKLCYACKKPVSDEDMLSLYWEDGISCPYCYETKSEKERERARARQQQYELWGLVGGPDKGKRRPASPKKRRNAVNNDVQQPIELSKSL